MKRAQTHAPSRLSGGEHGLIPEQRLDTEPNEVVEDEMTTSSNTITENMAASTAGTTSGETASIAEMFASLLREMRQMNQNIIAISEPGDHEADEAGELHQLEHEAEGA